MPPIFRIRSILLIIFLILLWGSAIIDIIKNNFTMNKKLIWIIVVVFIPLLGAALYFMIERKIKIFKK